MLAMREHLPEPGFYLFPGIGGANRSPEQMEVWNEKYRKGPIGVLVYHPTGRAPMAPRFLLTELATNVLAALVVSLLLAMAASAMPAFGMRVLAVAMVGLVPGLDVDVSYWNWYGFPASYTAAALTDHVIGWSLAGLALAAIHKSKPA